MVSLTPHPAKHLATSTWQVARHDLTRTQWVHTAPPALAPGEVRFAIDQVALTANNVTYGAFGDAMHYWDFFPTGDAAWGCVPVWGFATVVASTLAELPTGWRGYGYWPMASHAVLRPGRVSSSGFADAAPHRQHLHPLYNRYLACDTDPLHRAEHEGWLAVLRPLFMTSFLIDDMLASRGLTTTAQIVVSSASSKTALGTAWCLAQRPGVRTLGLTSPQNLQAVRRLGIYGEVGTYADLDSALTNDAAYIDFSGSKPLRRQVHQHWGDRLLLSSAIGATDWQHLGHDNHGARGALPGPKPELFFAPAQAATMQQRVGREDFGTAFGSAWTGFLAAVMRPEAPWLRLFEAVGEPAIEAAYREVLSGQLPADRAWLLRWTSSS